MRTHMEGRRETTLRKARAYLSEAEAFGLFHGTQAGPGVERAILSALMSLLWLQAAERETQGIRLAEGVLA